MTDLHSLLTRVEAAEGPDRELDRDLHAACGLDKEKIVHAGLVWNAYSASLDAALALVGEMLPGWDWSLHCDNGEAVAGIQPPSEDGCDTADCTAATPALAICVALLRAIAKQEVADAG